MVTIVVGEDIKVGVDERIYIDCGPQIDATGVPDPNVTWYFNGIELLNGSVPNVIISQDKRQSVIIKTSLAIDDQPSNSGNYTCKVCSDPCTCTSFTTTADVCGK